jgi:RND superfamily putative drug exporter
VLNRIATLAIAAPRRIIAVPVLVMVGAGTFGSPVTKSLASGGFQDPTSESWHASRLLSDKFSLGVPTERRHAALTRRTTHRPRGTEDER